MSCGKEEKGCEAEPEPQFEPIRIEWAADGDKGNNLVRVGEAAVLEFDWLWRELGTIRLMDPHLVIGEMGGITLLRNYYGLKLTFRVEYCFRMDFKEIVRFVTETHEEMMRKARTRIWEVERELGDEKVENGRLWGENGRLKERLAAAAEEEEEEKGEGGRAGRDVPIVEFVDEDGGAFGERLVRVGCKVFEFEWVRQNIRSVDLRCGSVWIGGVRVWNHGKMLDCKHEMAIVCSITRALAAFFREHCGTAASSATATSFSANSIQSVRPNSVRPARE